MTTMTFSSTIRRALAGLTTFCALSAIPIPVVATAQGITPTTTQTAPVLQAFNSARVSSAQATFDGIAAIHNCSAALVRLAGARDTDNALLLTNGHCVAAKVPKPGEVVLNEDMRRADQHLRSVTLLKGETPTRAATAHMTKVHYATMTGTDLALIEIDKSYLTLRLTGVHPREIAPAGATAGTKVSIPSGYLGTAPTCTVDAVVPTLVTAGYRWNNEMRYASGCATRPGSSGAPMIDEATGKIVGINNSGFARIDDCTPEDPCGEVWGNEQPVPILGARYGAQAAPLTGCVSEGKFSLQTPGCTLAKPE